MLPDSASTELARLSSESRAAFAAGCAERVFCLYTDKATPYYDDVWNTIEKVWGRAAGQPVSDAECQALLTILDRESRNYATEDGPEIPFGAIVATQKALQTAWKDSVADAIAAANFASGEVDRADALGDGGTKGLKEEVAWQRAWLRTCASVPADQARDEFEKTTTKTPAWYSRWES